ncbi:hypothetical protein, partial [Paraglaciecola hydrolytica]|uniref:hypothetical protein n=1 Tax=Paraglaciecola hydrolytica TaxID=1799789 RepID=UPI00138F8F1E
YLLFVTANPLTPGSKLSIGLLQTSVSNETGSISLIYCEYPFGEVDLLRLKYKSLDCSGQSQYVFMDNLRQVEFEYFGWKDRAALFTAQTELLSEIVKTEPYWQSDYSAMEKGILPNYMRIRFLTEQQNNSAMYFRIGDEDPRIAALSFGSFDE